MNQQTFIFSVIDRKSIALKGQTYYYEFLECAILIFRKSIKNNITCASFIKIIYCTIFAFFDYFMHKNIHKTILLLIQQKKLLYDNNQTQYFCAKKQK